MSTAAAVGILAGAAIQFKGAKDSAAAQEEAGKISSASKRNEDRSRTRQSVRDARIKQAQIAAASEALGTSGSSSTSTATSSLTTQVNANTARVAGQQASSDAISLQNQKSADAQVTQAFGSGIAGVSNQAFTATGGFDNLFKD